VSTDVYDAHHTHVLYCQQCDDPKCLKACPTGALHVDDKSGARVIDQKVCIGCQTCLRACIFYSTSTSRIKYNAETKKCFKCDLCGGDPECVKRCPLGASQLSWMTYKIVRPGIDDYKAKTVEGALNVVFKKAYTGPQAGKAQDEQAWACVAADKGAKAVGSITSSEGGELRVKMKAEFYDKDGNLLGSSAEHQWCLTMHESLKIELPFETADVSKIASVTLVGNVSYWVKNVDKEY
jgi:Fe-S-cluster-containing dehydrogenase component